jgi:phage terminase large subunit-like protein
MDWQRGVVDTALELDSRTGRLVYSEVVVSVPRQQGKSTMLLAVRAHRAIHPHFGGPQNILHTAQSRVAARTKLVDHHEPLLRRSAFAGAYKLRLSTGQESLLSRSGSIDGITATGETSGETLDLGVIDEAWAQPDARLEQAYRPAMLTRPQPQLWIVSTAGKPDLSRYLKGKVDAGRERALEGLTSDVAYFEWSADPSGDPGAVDTWRSAMPALGSTVTVEAVAGDYASMDVDEFRRSHLNVWPEAPRGSVFAPGVWDARARPEAATSGKPGFAFDVNPERTGSAIAAASDLDGVAVVEVVDHRPGTGWVVPRLAELVDRHKPRMVVCDAAGPAGSLLADLANAGVDVKVVSVREYGQGCGMFHDAVVDGTLVHPGQKALSDAVAAADRRTVADSWLWSRRSSTADISPLVAATLAHWAHRQGGPPERKVWMAWA